MEWEDLLRQMSVKIHNEVEQNMIYYDKTDVSDNWLGFEAAKQQAITEKEKELMATLPPSYKDFLLTSNGFRQISLFSGGLYPVEVIDWTKKKDPEFLAIFEKHDDIPVTEDDYFVYGENQRSVVFKTAFLKETLQISEWVDGSVILLNPMVKFGEEWEAWLYANWFPGAHRYRSFRDLIEGEYYDSVRLIDNPDS
ncbi:SMI1 / KNR4 family (SUKH-1) [Chryseolinea serpens]|uniref:SMI1 / KNR4 family (SUKH-1) n=1 Tax=Chryseolinea serpens TaxID=947013 RepID=A0A1M5R5T7_9BACT|nr:SMI1/KNR4 family protein [Chryseolinea serpens]SHH21339.1 SMI1 / KNR4 family (SUKH-1) [Chryseolinea serpens]